MNNIVTVQVKCPHCGVSLMDESKLIDNAQSIKLSLKVKGNKGYIWLSSVYQSYNIDSDLEIKDGDLADFSCPHCNAELNELEVCTDCGANMVSLFLNEGGKVSFCSRAGCKKHSVEFENLNTAMHHFYDAFAMQTNTQQPHIPVTPTVKSDEEEDLEIVEHGAFLQSYCPHCNMSLIEEHKISLKIETEAGESGVLHLSPYLNVFTHATTIKVPENTKVKEIKCIHCDKSLLHHDEFCPKCNSEIVGFNVVVLKKVIEFLFCSRKGCRWHGLSDEDLNFIKLEESEEW